MGLFAYSHDVDGLRAIAYARLQIASGAGLESVVASLEGADLGLVARDLRAPLARMRAGEDARAVLQEVVAKHPSRTFRELVACLLAEGNAAVERMNELSDEIQSTRKVRIEQFAKELEGRLKFMAILFVATFAQVFAGVFAEIPDNPILPSFTLPPTFIMGFFLVLTLVMTALVMLMRYRE